MADETRKQDTFGQDYEKEFEKVKGENPKPVILVAGATGAGKSTLINLVFGREVARTGEGQPVTQHTAKFENDFVILYDSKGYEHGEAAQEEFFKEIEQFIEKQQDSAATAINIAWYCISAPNSRILDVNRKLLRFFREKGIPTALIFTQVDCVSQDQLDALTEEARAINSSIPIFLSTNDEELAEQLKEKGLEKLYTWSLNHMAEAMRRAFRAACNRDLARKRSDGHSKSLQHATIAFGVGFSPIPFSDAPALIANQMTLIARLSYLWGLDLKPILTAGGILDLALTTLGKTIAGQLLKWIPGIGTLAGGMINGSVGAALTYGLGAAINESCYQYCKMQLEGKSGDFSDFFSPEVLMDLIKKFSEQYKAEKKKGA